MSSRESAAPGGHSVGWPSILLVAASALALVLLCVPLPDRGEDAPAEPTESPPEVKAALRLAEADRKSRAALESRLRTLETFFDRGRAGSAGFAEEALSWGGKWALVKETLGLGGDNPHAAFLSDAFGRHVFAGPDLEAAMAAAVEGYLLDLEGIESAMLVGLRVDLADGSVPPHALPDHLRSDEAFRKEYERFAGEASRKLHQEMGVTVGREVGLFVASDVAAQVALRVARFVAAELGVEAGILGAGAASGVATLGVGLVAALVLDYVLDAVLKLAGYDPAEEIAQKVARTLGNLQATLVEGEGGMRRELLRLHSARAAMRGEVVRRLLTEGGRP